MIRTIHTYGNALKAVEEFRKTADRSLRLEWVLPVLLSVHRKRGRRVFCRVLDKAGVCVREFAVKAREDQRCRSS